MADGTPSPRNGEENDRADETKSDHILTAKELMEAVEAERSAVASPPSASSPELGQPGGADGKLPRGPALSAAERLLLSQASTLVAELAAFADNAPVRSVMRDAQIMAGMLESYRREYGAMSDRFGKLMSPDLYANLDAVRNKLIPDLSAMAVWQDMQQAQLQAMQAAELHVAGLARRMHEMDGWKDNLTQITEIARLSQRQLTGVDTIGSALGASVQGVALLSDAFRDFSTAYSDVLCAYEGPPALRYQKSAMLLGTTREYFRGAVLNRAISVEPHLYDLGDIDTTAIADDRSATGDRLEQLLRTKAPHLLRQLRGARRAARSNNPERTSHTCISLRRFVEALLDTIAPVNCVRAWTTDPKDYTEKNDPTWAARVRYAYRDCGDEALTAFMPADARVVVTTMRLTSGMVHETKAELSEHGLLALVARVEGLAQSLLDLL